MSEKHVYVGCGKDLIEDADNWNIRFLEDCVFRLKNNICIYPSADHDNKKCMLKDFIDPIFNCREYCSIKDVQYEFD